MALARDDAADAWRIADLDDGPARLARRLGGTLAPPDAAAGVAGASPEPGVLAQADGRAAITALPPLGRLDPATAERLAELAEQIGTDELRLSPARTLTLLDVPPEAAARCVARLGALGLVTGPGSGWQGLTACAGLGACARARRDVRAIAAARAAVRGPGAPPEHWSACERDCGRPAGVEGGSR
jgi:sulfite reductase beta subunit-like hemoprotein